MGFLWRAGAFSHWTFLHPIALQCVLLVSEWACATAGLCFYTLDRRDHYSPLHPVCELLKCQVLQLAVDTLKHADHNVVLIFMRKSSYCYSAFCISYGNSVLVYWCPSGTSLCRSKTRWDRDFRFSLYDSLGPRVFCDRMSRRWV